MQEGKLGPRDKLKPCCSPTSYKSMDLLFYSGTREIRHRRVTDLLVSSCGGHLYGTPSKLGGCGSCIEAMPTRTISHTLQ
ncbi:hypothetical protein O3P69_004536 [Scylla paramamosain]|uniref:TGF-beta family profile domain-containing protein n=1 Tax=Scylla paramamosain TaxID=85552 RepID=A0AAW0UET1_SCYPA